MRSARGIGPLVLGVFVAGSALGLSACEGQIGGSSANSSAPGGPGQGSGAGANGAGGTGTGTGGASAGVVNGEFSRLTRAEYAATVSAALGVNPDLSLIPVDGRIGPFTSNGSVSPDPVHPYLLAAEDLAAEVIPDQLPECEGASVAECVTDNYREPLERLYRRPISEAELAAAAALVERLEGEGLSAPLSTRTLLLSALLSPDFLFRTSPVAGDDSAKARRVAEHSSYALWDAPPDAELAAVAEGPSAELPERLREQGARLTSDARAIPALSRFVAQWLHVDTDLRLEDPAFATSPRFLEFVAYVEDALANDVPVTSFISGQQGFVHRDNLDAYGTDADPGSNDSEIVAVTWPAESARRGVLGQDLLADATRHPDPTRRPIFRGLLVRRSLLCDGIPAPDPELIALAGEVGDRTADQRCAGCHLRIDPIGRAFASLDPDDSSGAAPAEVLGHAELEGTYSDLPALLDAVAASRAFAECFAQHWLAFFLEQPLSDTDTAWVSQIANSVQSGASLGAVVEQTIVTLAARSDAAEPWCTGP